jgi:hypothetical protein
LSRLPLMQAWMSLRDLPAPEGKTFHQLHSRMKAKDRP